MRSIAHRSSSSSRPTPCHSESTTFRCAIPRATSKHPADTYRRLSSRWIAALVSAALFVSLLMKQLAQRRRDVPSNAVRPVTVPFSNTRSQESKETDALTKDASRLQLGHVGSQNTSLYHCRSSALSSDSGVPTQNLVLLHGAAFTKEDWKTSGILESFCATTSVRRLVTALDLSVQSSREQLRQILDELLESGYVTHMPLTALVTPSASGKAVVEWHASSGGEASAAPLLLSYVSTWVTVASNSVSSVQPPELLASRFDGVNVLAIYGDQDATGRKSMFLLKQHVRGTALVELPGRHPCYLDSPKAFVRTIESHLQSHSAR